MIFLACSMNAKCGIYASQMQKVLGDRICVGMMDVKELAHRINQK